LKDVCVFPEQQHKGGRLVEMLLNEAWENDGLRERLFLETARMSHKRIYLATCRRAFKNASRANNYVDYNPAVVRIFTMGEAIRRGMAGGFGGQPHKRTSAPDGTTRH
jgi:hypothetical protein